jgi:hypothetical protein
MHVDAVFWLTNYDKVVFAAAERWADSAGLCCNVSPHRCTPVTSKGLCVQRSCITPQLRTDPLSRAWNLAQGKKGIALTADQFQSLKHAADQLTKALQSSDVSCSLALGHM